KLFHQHGQKIVMIARFLPGLRAVTYFTAGSARMRYRWFILYDGLAALISAPLFVFLGFRFGGDLEILIAAVRRGQVKVIAGLLVLILGYVLWTRIRKRREVAQAAADAKATEAAKPGQLKAQPEVERAL